MLWRSTDGSGGWLAWAKSLTAQFARAAKSFWIAVNQRTVAQLFWLLPVSGAPAACAELSGVVRVTPLPAPRTAVLSACAEASAGDTVIPVPLWLVSRTVAPDAWAIVVA